MLLRTSAAAAAIAVISVLAASQQAAADVLHTVRPGETLWSIAAAHNYTTRSVAVANGMSEHDPLRAGETIRIPSPGASDGPPPTGGYTVRPGDTLSELAAASGVGLDQLAWMNGIDPDGLLLAGTALKLPAGVALAEAPSPAPTQIADAPPHPTEERVDADFVKQIAVAHGVPPSLAAAIAHQESGFNNAVVSPANARGVMQILPGTWRFIESTLAGSPLAAASASDNVHAGVMYLGQLLSDTGGDEVFATAAYYQGLSSVRTNGLLPATQAYVDNVMALRSRYGG